MRGLRGFLMSLPVLVRGACPHDCPDTCGVVTEVRDGRAVAFRGDPDHPITRGWLCAKVRPYLDHVYHPDRLLLSAAARRPQGRRPVAAHHLGRGARQKSPGRWQAIIAESGAEAILPYSYSGTLGLVQNDRLRAPLLEPARRQPAAAQHLRRRRRVRRRGHARQALEPRRTPTWSTAGWSSSGDTTRSAPRRTSCRSCARRSARGCKVVVIDPRRTQTAETADLHLAPLPGTDGFLAMGLAHVLVAEGLHDEAGWRRTPSAGRSCASAWPSFRRRRRGQDRPWPRRTSSRWPGCTPTCRPGLIKIADGINRNRNGGQNVRADLRLPALTGQYGMRGGGLAYSTSGYLQWDGRRRPSLGGLSAAGPQWST